jgi:hypothetical protein
MSSDRKITANRTNAKKSTGPRSKAGREAGGPEWGPPRPGHEEGDPPAVKAGQLATVLSLSSGAQKVSEHARQAAEAELDLTRIRKIRARLFETLYFADTAAPGGMTELNDALAKLERYERRAFSRRKRALRAV